MKNRKNKKENKLSGSVEFKKYDWFVIASQWASDHSRTNMPFRRRQWARAKTSQYNK